MKLTKQQIAQFHEPVLSHYDKAARFELPWRKPDPTGMFDPYKIWISELMLQQTQVSRVVPKYQDFLRTFPDIPTLASANLGEVLIAWQGLGYNRRAKYLWQAAQQIERDYGGQLPQTAEDLARLPGIGRNTAGAITAYAYNLPAVFIETNIRTVYFHHFFEGQTDIADKVILPLIQQTITSEPRDFYWALMDYGSHLKKKGHGKISQSSHYVKQSKFEGSLRQIRGRALKLLAAQSLSAKELIAALGDQRAPEVLAQLEREGMIQSRQHSYHLA